MQIVEIIFKNPRNVLHKIPSLESLGNLPNVVIFQKSAKIVWGGFPLTRAQAACLVRPFVYIFFCDTVASTYLLTLAFTNLYLCLVVVGST
jgi:hypothetical protein